MLYPECEGRLLVPREYRQTLRLPPLVMADCDDGSRGVVTRRAIHRKYDSASRVVHTTHTVVDRPEGAGGPA